MVGSLTKERPLNTPTWLEVWLEAGREGQVFTYANGDLLDVRVGDLVQVPLRGRRHAGLVTGCKETLSKDLAGKTILSIESVLQRAAVDPGWQELIVQVAKLCHTSVFRTLKSALPPGWLGLRTRRNFFGGRQLWEIQRIKTDEDVAVCAGSITKRQRETLEILDSRGGRLLLRDLVNAGASNGVVKALENKNLVQRKPAASPRDCMAVGGDEFEAEAPQKANSSQAAAVAAIIAGSPGQAFLLWGVTGAGKTEIYLQTSAKVLKDHHSVLILTPEIGLIPQLMDRCRARFGPRVIQYHSGMRKAERVEAWRRCLETGQNGEGLVAVGTRSAVFLPLERLGLIVLDEEHDGSYKQESPMPCYHARDVARLRAKHCGCHLVLGSATPSLESWIRSSHQHGDTVLLRLPERIGRRPLPPVRVVDMRLELAEGHRRLISRALMGRLQSLRQRSEQAVVLIPRRGYRAFLSCRSCGEAALCPHCDVPLTVHRNSDGYEWLRCHWCDHRQDMGRICAHCGSTAFKPFGAGTQRVMEKLALELTGLRLLRFDQDSTRGPGGHRRLLERFAAGEADVLVGTQMLAKGMDLPTVTLAVVLAADGLMNRPDLRSSEHCLQLLLQLAGRAGRGERPGEVLIQTYSPDHPVIRHFKDGRYEQFLEEEIQLRRQGGMVPFCRACLLRLAGPSAAKTATAATVLAESIRESAEWHGWCLVGPSPAPVARVAGRSRWQLLLHGPRLGKDHLWAEPMNLPLPPESALRQLLPTDVSLAIDPDPLQL